MSSNTHAASHQGFWPQHLEGVTCIFPRLSEEPPSAQPRHTTSHEQRIRCASGTASLDALCTNGLQPRHFHLAAWCILLSRYLGDGQVCSGTVEKSPFDGSHLFSACRLQVDKDDSPSAVVLACKEALEQCRPHACRTAGDLIQQIGSAQQRFNTAVIFEGVTESAMRSFDDGHQHFDLLLKLEGPGAGLSAYLELSPLLSKTSAALVAATYRTILSGVVESFSQPLCRMAMVSQKDLQRTWNWNRACPEPVHGLVQDYFQHYALSQPNAPAICASDVSFTYQELDNASNILANFLVARGVGPEVVVPLCFEKSGFATLAMLAVVKAGGAFTFLDPTYPIDRLQNVIQQVDAKFVLSSATNMTIWHGRLPAYEVSTVAISALPKLYTSPPVRAAPSSLCYLIFTSGSTGQPKGVCISHENYLSCALDQSRVCSMDSSSRVLQFASYTFDVSVLENFTTLVTGGCVCVPDDAARAKGIASIMNEFEVTWAFLTPSLVKLIGPGDVPTLETLVLGGEALSKSDVETWAGKVQLMNGYGPTECSIASAIHPAVEKHTAAGNIGWPVGGLLWVVDAENYHELVPIGGIGELAIEGPHLARGYLNDPVKTAKAFVENADWMADYPSDRQKRIYLTGDLVRSNTDGSIHFIGRKDTQVKIRGLRIELGDIEHHISVDPLVGLAIVIAPETGACKKRLVGVVTLAGTKSTGSGASLQPLNAEHHGAENSVRNIQIHLGEKVPAYMVPSTWIVLEAFPLTPSGKIDRVKVKKWVGGMDAQALAEAECLLAQPLNGEGTTVDAPADVEEALRAVVAHVLNLAFEAVSPSRSFVNLGGDSISAMQLVSRCKLQGMQIKSKDILQCGSLAELATFVEMGKQAVIEVEEVFDVPFDLSPIQQLYFQLEPKGTHPGGANRFNQSFLLRLRQRQTSESVLAALTLLVKRHSMLRCQFVKSSVGTWQQMIPSTEDGSFSFKKQRALTDEDVQAVIVQSQCKVANACPVFVVDLIETPRGQLLSMIAHHAIVDLVSWRVIMQELEELLLGGALSAPQKPLPWQVWCKLQAEYAMEHLPPRAAFPDAIETPNMGYWGMTGRRNMIKDATKAVFQLDAATTALLTGAESHSVLRTEPVDLFLSAIIHSFTMVFQDRKAPTIFRESHGRWPWDDAIDIGSTVGWFTSMYPVSVVAGKDPVDTVRRVKDAQRRVPSSGWPYFASRYHHPDGIRQFGGYPQAEIQFDYLGLYQQLERDDALFQQEAWPNSDVGPEFNRLALFEITAEIIRSTLR